jgi:propionyl-CoA carboxylase alpha chain
MEARFYAEDPLRNFLPSIGRLTTYREPKHGAENPSTCRVEALTVSLASLCVHVCFFGCFLY